LSLWTENSLAPFQAGLAQQLQMAWFESPVRYSCQVPHHLARQGYDLCGTAVVPALTSHEAIA